MKARSLEVGGAISLIKLCFSATQAVEFLSQLEVNGFPEQQGGGLASTLLALVFLGVDWEYQLPLIFSPFFLFLSKGTHMTLFYRQVEIAGEFSTQVNSPPK